MKLKSSCAASLILAITSLMPALLLFISGNAFAISPYLEIQQDPRKAGGVYYAYPDPENTITPPPSGYKPFYVSHYGRHGSRYLISDRDYRNVADVLRKADKAGKLTPLGIKVLANLDSLMKETDGMGGALTPLGVRQHKEIAKRLFDNYPEIFKGDAEVSARSTIVPRCILSMDAFCESLKEQNPEIKTTRESADRYMSYLNYHSEESNRYTSGDWKIERQNYEDSRLDPSRLMKALFNDPAYVRKEVRAKDLAWGLYWIAVDEQNVETKLNFMDLFTADELYDFWVSCNFSNYVTDADYAPNGGLVVGNARNLLRNIMESADKAIKSGKNSATLRFGHDGNLMPLAAILGLEGASESVDKPIDSIPNHYANYRISPMAGNVQIIFFRNTKKRNKKETVGIDKPEILVKFLLNEKETAIPLETSNFPFYDWNKVKDFYKTKLK